MVIAAVAVKGQPPVFITQRKERFSCGKTVMAAVAAAAKVNDN